MFSYRLESFRTFFSEYFPYISVYAQRFVNDVDIAKDIAQDCFVCLWNEKIEFNSIQEVRRFLYTLAKNRCLNYLRHEGVKEKYANSLHIEYDEGIEIDTESHDLLLMLRKMITSLPTKQRLIVELTMEGKKNSEIAELLDIAEGTVHSAKKKAYKSLRIAMVDYIVCFFLINK